MDTLTYVIPGEIPWGDFACKNMEHQNKESWLQSRKGFITASEAAVVYNVAPDAYGSRWSLWNEKIGGNVPEASADMTEIMEYALDDEELIARRYKKRHPERLLFRPTQHSLQVSIPFPWLACSLDWLVWDPEKGWGILEMKSVLGFKGHEWDNEGIPKHFMFQTQQQMLVIGLDWGTLAVRIGSQHHEVEFSRHQRFCESLVDPKQPSGLYEFYHNNMCEEEPPSPDGNEATTKAMIDYFGEPEKNLTVSLPPAIEEIDHEWQVIAETVKILTTRKKQLGNQVRDMLLDKDTQKTAGRGVGDMGIKYGCITTKETVVPEYTRKAGSYIKRLGGPKIEDFPEDAAELLDRLQNG